MVPGRLVAGESEPSEAPDLLGRAAAILRGADRGTFTRTAPVLYPHQWSLDSAIIAVGWAHLDPLRGMTELDGLLETQWSDGKLPHIVFRPGGEYYVPGPDFWQSWRSPAAPPAHLTSGLAAPPVHGLCATAVWRVAARGDPPVRRHAQAFAERIYPRLLAWHRYLIRERDPEGSGLLTIYHPWESLDNSPQWDAPLEEVAVGDVEPYERHDIHVVSAAERPTGHHYDRYIWLLQSLREARYEDARIRRAHPFLLKDVFCSALFAASSAVLLELADALAAPDSERTEIEATLQAARRGLSAAWNDELRLCLGTDLLRSRPLIARTVAGLFPLLVAPEESLRSKLLEQLDSEAFAGHASLQLPLPPSTSPLDPSFDRRNYWRGPVWPVINWLIWLGLRACGAEERAGRLRRDALAQVDAGGFAEYHDPFSGEPLGSREQSWTAAVVIDWLKHER
jgi:hypothetical protein